MRPFVLVHKLFVVLLLAALSVPPVSAEPLPAPTGPVLLRVSGAIAVTNRDGEAVFDREMLRALPWTEIRTATEWTEGEQRFGGVLMADLFARLGGTGTKIFATALNDYRVDIPVSDFRVYKVLLALEQEGAPMPVREKGPIWVIYPTSDPSGKVPLEIRDRMIWQVKSLELR